MGIFRIFPKEDREFVTFKTGILGGPGKVNICVYVVYVRLW